MRFFFLKLDYQCVYIMSSCPPGCHWCASLPAHLETRVNQSSLITETPPLRPPVASVNCYRALLAAAAAVAATTTSMTEGNATIVSSLMNDAGCRFRSSAVRRSGCDDVCATILDHRARTRTPNPNRSHHV